VPWAQRPRPVRIGPVPRLTWGWHELAACHILAARACHILAARARHTMAAPTRHTMAAPTRHTMAARARHEPAGRARHDLAGHNLRWGGEQFHLRPVLRAPA
jgi:hypothetical protein